MAWQGDLEFLDPGQTAHLSWCLKHSMFLLIRRHFDLGSKAIVEPLGVAQFLAMFLLPVLKEISIGNTEF